MQAAILNALPARVALIDPAGVILAVNDSWRRFDAANLLDASESGVGQNYLDICERALGDDAGRSSDRCSRYPPGDQRRGEGLRP